MLCFLTNPDEFARLQARLTKMLWKRFFIASQDAEDVISAAVATYLEVHGRYDDHENHVGIFMGVVRRKALEHIERSSRERRRLERFVRARCAWGEGARFEPEGRGAQPSTAEVVMQQEDAVAIREEVARHRDRLEPALRIAGGESRLALVTRLGVNKNTLDSRLRAARKKFRAALHARNVQC